MGLKALTQQNPTGTVILRQRFMDKKLAKEVGNQLNCDIDQLKRLQRAAIDDLTQIIWEQETAVRTQRIQDMQSQLYPADYRELFGIDAQAEALLTYLQQPDGPWLIALTGIGGIGKTALADKVTRQLIEQLLYEQIAWIKVESVTSAGLPTTPETIWNQIGQQLALQFAPDLGRGTLSQQIGAVRQQLKRKPMLVIIDNLETEESAAYLADKLLDLSNPGKFLVTSRSRFPNTAAVLPVYLNEMEETAVYQFIKHLAAEKGIQDLIKADSQALAAIYRVTGGNPLALKVVVGLTQVMALPEILQDFEQVHATEIEQMYRHIYWKAWHTLDEAAQTLLEIMPLASQKGMLPEQLQAASGLSGELFWPAVHTLVNRSLIDVTGTVWQKRYSAHQLLISFISSQLLRLPAR
ncbi:MAG: AAA family ATPase [Anaerolineales bacterium]|nr:AAA family ATPase [Anaerolineales bacterium]